jgi:hypothetical protein
LVSKSDNYFWFTDDIEVATKFATKDINKYADKYKSKKLKKLLDEYEI